MTTDKQRLAEARELLQLADTRMNHEDYYAWLDRIRAWLAHDDGENDEDH